jgi:hypothetical protein
MALWRDDSAKYFIPLEIAAEPRQQKGYGRFQDIDRVWAGALRQKTPMK